MDGALHVKHASHSCAHVPLGSCPPQFGHACMAPSNHASTIYTRRPPLEPSTRCHAPAGSAVKPGPKHVESGAECHIVVQLCPTAICTHAVDRRDTACFVHQAAYVCGYHAAHQSCLHAMYVYARACADMHVACSPMRQAARLKKTHASASGAAAARGRLACCDAVCHLPLPALSAGPASSASTL